MHGSRSCAGCAGARGTLGLALVALAGCGKRRDEHAGLPPATEWGEPTGGGGAAPIAPGEPDPHAGVDMSGGGVPADLGEPDPHAGVDMAGGAAGDVDPVSPHAERTMDPNKYLRGTIEPSAAMKAKIPASAVVFLSVKAMDPSTGEAVGAAFATEKYPATFPITFDVNASADGDVLISAWWDQNGDAIDKMPGDIIGTVKARIPAKDLRLTLDRELPR